MAATKIGQDGGGKSFVEVNLGGGEYFRMTTVPAGEAWSGRLSVRMQLRGKNGRLRQGPEVPLKDFIKAVSAEIGALASYAERMDLAERKR